MRPLVFIGVIIITCLVLGESSFGVTSEDQALRLGKDLTPIGAEKAGNAEGTIPEWTGGITSPPANWKPGTLRPDPFAEDKALFSIDSSNVDQYAEKLSKGQIELIKKYEGYRMDIYPTRRPCAYPDWFYEKTALNALSAKLGEHHAADDLEMGENRIYLEGGWGGVLFPIPNNGAEVIWNHNTSFMPIGKIEINTTIVSTEDGAVITAKEQGKYRVFFHDNRRYTSIEGANRAISYFVLTKLDLLQLPTQIPARQSENIGEGFLIHEMANSERRVWHYLPVQRRVRRAPGALSFDKPLASTDGLMTADQVRLFNGVLDRFDWKLLGKKEMYIPYDNLRYYGANSASEDIFGPRYPNRDWFRYELHRVWVVEAMLHEGESHLFSKRVFYVDEDSWTAVAEDIYDRNGKLWRIMEQSPVLIWELPACVADGSISYDLFKKRYVADRVKVDEPSTRWITDKKDLSEYRIRDCDLSASAGGGCERDDRGSHGRTR